MQMDVLYTEMKKALDYFELPFGAMGEVSVLLQENQITFAYNGRGVTYMIRDK